MIKTKFAIGIPTYNRADLLLPALMFYARDYPNTEIFVIDNGNQDIKISKIPNLKIIVSENNIGVAASWNKLCDIIYEQHDFAMILNDDIYLGRKEWEIDNFLTNYKKDLYISTQDWCSFILPKKTFEDIGRFDEQFYPAYFEDNDYTYRLILNLKSIYQVPFLNPFIYKSSQSILKEPSLRDGYLLNEKRYVEKWGGKPKFEKFRKPYNK
jgi:GT2 family glycosyltransferase